jgi:Ca2+-binding RTX toxin-like protein
LYGGKDDDRLEGGAGDDLLIGGDGWGVLDGGPGADSMYGGRYDYFDVYYVDNIGDHVQDVEDGGHDVVWASVDFTLPALSHIEDLILEGAAIRSTGNALDNRMQANGDLDSHVRGREGDDQLIGHYGNDILEGGLGDDDINGGFGADSMLGGAGNDTLLASVDEEDGIPDDGSADFLSGGAGDDALGSDGTGTTLDGGTGADFLIGAGSTDTLDGGPGADSLYGGEGDDTFVFAAGDSTPAGRDFLTDWRTAPFENPGADPGDVIDVSAIDADRTTAGDQAFVFGTATGKGRLWATNGGEHRTVIRGNVDDDAAAEFALAIDDGAVLASAYAAEDFIL